MLGVEVSVDFCRKTLLGLGCEVEAKAPESWTITPPPARLDLEREVDLIEAHKWFNLAAVAGHDEAKTCRAEIADEMTARDIAEAQRRARRRLPRSVYGALVAGSERGLTLHEFVFQLAAANANGVEVELAQNLRQGTDTPGLIIMHPEPLRRGTA